MKVIKNLIWLVGTFIWSQMYVFLLLIGLVFFIVFVIVSVKIARNNFEEFMILLKTMASFILPSLISLFGMILGLRKLLGSTTMMSKLIGLIILPVALFIGYKGYILYWEGFQLTFNFYKVTLVNLWKA